jgi:site-specific DNA recombinase
VEGKRENARLIVSEERIEGLTETEADIIRLVYSWTVDEGISCQKIAERLNAMGVPPAYVRDGREVLRGKRVAATQGIWRSGRIRNMIVNPVYMGIHRYGTRTKKDREVIEREVPAIVSVEMWQRAQAKLQEHMIYSPKNKKREYLLRGLIICGVCGLHYTGYTMRSRSNSGNLLCYYVCTAYSNYRGIYGGMGKKCPSRPVNGYKLEARVWADVEGFLRNPGDVLAELAAQKHDTAAHQENLRDEIARLQQQAQAKQGEKDTVITLYRRGRIDAAALDRQLDQIQREDAELRERINGLQADIREAQDAEGGLNAAGDMLTRLSTRLEEPMTFELKRDIVTALVERITIDTVTGEDGKPHARARIKYRFQGPDPSDRIYAATGTGTDSWPK